MSSYGLNIRVPKESLIRLKELENKEIVVKFNGGREIWGQLRSWDKSMNLSMSATTEVLEVQGKEEVTRNLGAVIVKGSQIHSISLKDGYTIIDNPFEGDEEGEEQPQI